jgi:Domain of unknown function (DUF4349)
MKRLPLIKLALFLVLALIPLLTACAYPTATPASAPPPGANNAPAAGAKPSSGNAPGEKSERDTRPINAVTDPNRMIIRNATISLESQDVEKTLADIRALVIAQQGLVFSSNTSLKDDKTYATMVLQVPVQVYDGIMAQLRKIAFKVVSETSTSQDVTEEFADAQSQLRNLQATEAQFLELLKKTTNLNDIITVQNQITTVRGQIEKIQGRMNFLQKKSDMSTITINIAPHIAPTVAKTESKTADFGEAVKNAWDGSITVIQGLGVVLVTLGIYLLWLLPLGLAILLGGMVVRRKFFPRKSKEPTMTGLE